MPELHVIEFNAELACLCGEILAVDASMEDEVRCVECKRRYAINVSIARLWADLIQEKRV